MYFRVPSWTSWSTQRLPTCTWTSPDKRKHTYQLSKSLVTRWRIQQNSTQVFPEFTQQNELHHPLLQFQFVLKSRIASHQRPSCFIFRSITMVEKLQPTSTSILGNVQLRKMILEKISLSWWTTRSLVSLLYVSLFLCIDSFVDSFIVPKFLSFCLFVHMYWFIHFS